MRNRAVFITVRIVADYELEGAGRRYGAGEVVDLRDWLAEKMVRRGVARFVMEAAA